jgi:dUTP pyrophosphatase
MSVRYVEYELMSDNARTPFKQHMGDAGWDLFCAESVDIPPHATKDIHTDIKIDMPPYLFARITGRSSTLRNHHLIVNEGIIDNGYTGEMFICVHNMSDETFHVKKGMRLAQILFHSIEDVRWTLMPEIRPCPGKRGNNGFGSTGE